MMPRPNDWLAFAEAARGHEVNAARTGSLVEGELARMLRREATSLRLAALRPPQRCIECGNTIAGEERMCGRCGRARQGIRIGPQEVLNLVRFFNSYNGHAIELRDRNQKNWNAKRRARRLAKLQALGCICCPTAGKRRKNCPVHGKARA